MLDSELGRFVHWRGVSEDVYMSLGVYGRGARVDRIWRLCELSLCFIFMVYLGPGRVRCLMLRLERLGCCSCGRCANAEY